MTTPQLPRLFHVSPIKTDSVHNDPSSLGLRKSWVNKRNSSAPSPMNTPKRSPLAASQLKRRNSWNTTQKKLLRLKMRMRMFKTKASPRANKASPRAGTGAHPSRQNGNLTVRFEGVADEDENKAVRLKRNGKSISLPELQAGELRDALAKKMAGNPEVLLDDELCNVQSHLRTQHHVAWKEEQKACRISFAGGSKTLQPMKLASFAPLNPQDHAIADGNTTGSLIANRESLSVAQLFKRLKTGSPSQALSAFEEIKAIVTEGSAKRSLLEAADWLQQLVFALELVDEDVKSLIIDLMENSLSHAEKKGLMKVGLLSCLAKLMSKCTMDFQSKVLDMLCWLPVDEEDLYRAQNAGLFTALVELLCKATVPVPASASERKRRGIHKANNDFHGSYMLRVEHVSVLVILRQLLRDMEEVELVLGNGILPLLCNLIGVSLSQKQEALFFRQHSSTNLELNREKEDDRLESNMAAEIIVEETLEMIERAIALANRYGPDLMGSGVLVMLVQLVERGNKNQQQQAALSLERLARSEECKGEVEQWSAALMALFAVLCYDDYGDSPLTESPSESEMSESSVADAGHLIANLRISSTLFDSVAAALRQIGRNPDLVEAMQQTSFIELLMSFICSKTRCLESLNDTGRRGRGRGRGMKNCAIRQLKIKRMQYIQMQLDAAFTVLLGLVELPANLELLCEQDGVEILLRMMSISFDCSKQDYSEIGKNKANRADAVDNSTAINASWAALWEGISVVVSQKSSMVMTKIVAHSSELRRAVVGKGLNHVLVSLLYRTQEQQFDSDHCDILLSILLELTRDNYTLQLVADELGLVPSLMRLLDQTNAMGGYDGVLKIILIIRQLCRVPGMMPALCPLLLNLLHTLKMTQKKEIRIEVLQTLLLMARNRSCCAWLRERGGLACLNQFLLQFYQQQERIKLGGDIQVQLSGMEGDELDISHDFDDDDEVVNYGVIDIEEARLTYDVLYILACEEMKKGLQMFSDCLFR